MEVEESQMLLQSFKNGTALPFAYSNLVLTFSFCLPIGNLQGEISPNWADI